MSGGHFEYMQYHIREIAETLEIDINGKDLDEEDITQMRHDLRRGWISKEYFDYCEANMHTPPCEEYEPKTIAQFKRGYVFLRIAEIYAQRIDWLQSGDDGEETFHERLEEDMAKLAIELADKDNILIDELKKILT